MRHKASFPALAGTISAINRVTAGHEHSVQELSNVLLKDFALTNKLLRLVNSTGYGQFGGSISTISRAVLILGFDAVRDLGRQMRERFPQAPETLLFERGRFDD